LAVGDIMLSRKTAAAIDAANDPLLPFKKMRGHFEAVDFTFGNLESMFSSSDKYSTGPAHIFNVPKKNIAGLVKYRFAVLNLANNHAFDQGIDGIKVTLSHLHRHGLKTIGVGLTNEAAWKTAIHEVRGVRIGFVGAAYSSVNDDGSKRLPFVARMQQAGKMIKAIRELRQNADFVVATMHAGVEYIATALNGQRLFAQMVIDAGADIMIGHHPHVVQDVEIYKGKYVFYSLGNFVFDHTKPHTNEGAAVRIDLKRKPSGTVITRLEVIPYIIENLVTPRPATPAEAAPILKRMKLKKALLLGG